MEPVCVMADPLRDFCRAVFRKAGAIPEHADILADTLVEANLRGVDTHGVMRLQIYATRIEKKLLNTDPNAIKILSETSTTCLMDGADSAGQILGVMAMEKAVALARASGVGIVAVRNSNNFGAAAYYAMLALPHHMIGVVIGEAGPNLAPYGAAEAALGSNPLAIAVPAGEFPPVVLDMAMSVAAGGKIRKAAKEGKPIPEGWIINSEGIPSTDPNDYVDPSRKGCLVPFAGHKGSGLAVMISLLAGAMSGPTFGINVGPAFSLEKAAHAGQLYIAIRIDNFCDRAQYKSRVDQEIRSLKNTRRAQGVEEIFVPGEIEANTRAKRLKGGIPLGPAIMEELKVLAQHFQVEFPAVVK